MAKRELRSNQVSQWLTIRGCQVLCALFLLLSVSGALEVANAQTLVWPFEDGCHDGYDIQLRFFDQDNDLVWPSSTEVYILQDADSYSLSCLPNAKVCYGAERYAPGLRNTSHWGVGIHDDQYCDDCCYRCPFSGTSHARTTLLTCGGGGTGAIYNDGFSYRIAISGTSGRETTSNTAASKEFGEPDHAGNRGGASLWWSWTAPVTGTVIFDTLGSDFDTVLAVYTGFSVDRLTEVASDDDTDGLQSQVSFTAYQGVVYHVAVDGYDDAAGSVVLNWSRAGGPGLGGPGANSFILRTAVGGASGQVTDSSVGATKEFGEPDHAGNRGGASLWWSWTAPATGTVTFDTLGSNYDTVLAVYTGLSIGGLREVASDDDTVGRQSRVSFTAYRGSVYHVAVDGYNGAAGFVVLNWNQAGVPRQGGPGADSFLLRTAIGGAWGQVTDTNAVATKEFREPSHAGNRGGASLWWSWTAPATGTVTFDTLGSNFDTVLAVYTGLSVGGLREVASDDDTEGLQSQVSFTAYQGAVYHVAVDGYGGATGLIVLNWHQAGIPRQGGPGADSFTLRTAIGGASGQVTDTNVVATKEFGEPYHAGNRGGASLWWSWTAPATGTVTFDTWGSGFDTVLAVYTGLSVGGLTEVASNDDTEGLQSQVSFWAYRGAVYHVAVDGYNGATGFIVLNWD